MKSYQFARVSAMGIPTVYDVENMFIFGEVVHLINVSGHKLTKKIQAALREHGVTVYDLPLVENGPDMGFENIIKAVGILMEADRHASSGRIQGGNQPPSVQREQWSSAGTHNP